jgi:hypothetical protein
VAPAIVGAGGFGGMVRGLAQPFAARPFGKRGGLCIVPLDGSIEPRGFNRRKLEDQSVKAARDCWASDRRTGAAGSGESFVMN